MMTSSLPVSPMGQSLFRRRFFWRYSTLIELRKTHRSPALYMDRSTAARGEIRSRGRRRPMMRRRCSNSARSCVSWRNAGRLTQRRLSIRSFRCERRWNMIDRTDRLWERLEKLVVQWRGIGPDDEAVRTSLNFEMTEVLMATCSAPVEMMKKMRRRWKTLRLSGRSLTDMTLRQGAFAALFRRA